MTTPYQWYYHDKTRNETGKAVEAAVKNGCGLLVFAGKPGCAICNAVWSGSYLDGAGKLAAYLKNNRLIGLKIDDSQSHFSDLASTAMGYRNADGTATNTNAPFLALVKVKDTGKAVTKFTFKNANVEAFFGGYGSLVISDKTYAKVVKWLDGVIGSAKYRDAFQKAAEAPAEEEAPAVATKPGAGTAAADGVGKWYCHSAAKNETEKAVQAALDNGCGLLVVVGKPDCSTCAKAWSKSYMDGDGKLQEYLKEHRLVGLKVDDSQSHAQSIGSGINSYYNYDKTKTDKNVPFLLLVKPKAGVKTFETLKKKTSIDVFFGGFGSKTLAGQTYENVAAWLDKLLDPKLSYYDGRDNYAAVYGGSVQHPSSGPVVGRYEVVAKLECTIVKSFEAAGESEARKMAADELKASLPALPDGWDSVSCKATFV